MYATCRTRTGSSAIRAGPGPHHHVVSPQHHRRGRSSNRCLNGLNAPRCTGFRGPLQPWADARKQRAVLLQRGRGRQALTRLSERTRGASVSKPRPSTRARSGRRAGARVETAPSTTGAVDGAKLEVSLATRLDDSASARPGGGIGERAPLLLPLVARVVGCREDPAIMRRWEPAVTMHRADPTTRRPSRPPYPAPRDDLASGRPDVGGGDRDRRGRCVQPHGLARGSRRWAIRWAKPRRIGPYQARRKTPAGWQLRRLQVFSRVKGATNAMPHYARGRWFETTRGPSQKGHEQALCWEVPGTAAGQAGAAGVGWSGVSLPQNSRGRR